ncbi:hypothetical protein LBMAG48_24050 [Phycisphaerae bacterium]|nr:hypothetical protein LBMAG48_24050 [Phycisphaerae bacterium]
MTRPYPWRCGTCGNKSVGPAVVPFTATLKHENTVHEVHLEAMPANKCDVCGEISVGEDADTMARDKLRETLGLLPAEVILQNRKLLEKKQDELAELLRVSEASISHWENGRIQSRSSDVLLRLYFAIPQVRHFLQERMANPKLGEQVNEDWSAWRAELALPPNYPINNSWTTMYTVTNDNQNPYGLAS